jgi:hypothetical protein
MPEKDYIEPEYRSETSEVRGDGYIIQRRGGELRPPFADIFHYSDGNIQFFFRAARFTIGNVDGEFLDNNEYVVDALWKSDESLQYPKANLSERSQVRALRNIVDGLHYMWSGSKPPPAWVRVQLRAVA